MKLVIRLIAFSCAMLAVFGANADYFETTGEITLEAEDYQRYTPQDNETWSPACVFANPPTPSGDSAMLATGTFHANDELATSPHLEFDIFFTTNGTYTAWVKGDGSHEGDNSVHAGLDGVRIGSAVDNNSIDFNPALTDFSWSSWSFYGNAGSAPEFTFEITDATPAGTLHTFDLWLREGDVFVDKIFLTTLGTDPASVEPTADDPAAGGGMLPIAATPVINPNGGFFHLQDGTDPTDVTFTTCTSGAKIHYTTDGSVPTSASTSVDSGTTVPSLIVGPGNTTVKAITSMDLTTPGTRNDSAVNAVDFVNNAIPTRVGGESFTVNEDGTKTGFDLFANGDMDLEDGAFPEPALSNGASYSISTLPANGTLVDNGDGTIDYTHDGSETTTDSFKYKLQDSLGAQTNGVRVDITVIPQNDPPMITGTPATTVAQDIAYSFTPVSSDVDGDILLFSIANQPSWASFNSATGELSGTPTNADVGATTGIVISVDDQQGQPNSVASLPTFDLAVTNVNDAPTIGGTPATGVAQNTPYSFTPTSDDIDGDTLVFSITNPPSWADFDAATGALTGTPTNADVGTTTGIVITVDDQQGQPNSTASLPSFDLIVVDDNNPPAFTSTAITGATTDVAYTYNITSSDPDAGDTLVVSQTMLPAWLTLTDGGAGDGSALLAGTPTSAEIGDHNVVLVVTDSGSGNLTDTQSFTITVASPNVASILPGSRAVPVGGTATAFATMVNAGASPLTGCGIAPVTQVPAGFSYQTTDPVTNALTGTPDTPVDLAPGASQSFLIAFTPAQAIAATQISFDFSCDGAGQTAAIPGINTFLLSASSTPGPDIIALAASNPPGQLILSSAGAFAVATANVGATGSVTVSADTGATSLPVTITLCETNPATGACVNPATPTSAPINMTINAGATPTFGVFVSGDTPIPFDPAANRVFFRIQNGSGDLIASTSVAVSKP